MMGLKIHNIEQFRSYLLCLFASTICISGWHGVPGSQKGSTENARGSGYDPAVEEITTGAKVKLNTQVHRQKQDTLDLKMLMN